MPHESSHIVEVYVRSLASGDQQAQIRESRRRLEELVDTDVIDEYEIHVWGDGVCLDSPLVETETGAFIRERVAAFREWAHETGHELVGFANRTTRSAITGRVNENVVVPTMAACERRGDVIKRVAPSRSDADGTLTTVADLLSTLERIDNGQTGEVGGVST